MSSDERSAADPATLVATRLAARRDEVEQAIRTQVTAIAAASRVAVPEYANCLRRAVFAAVDFSRAAIERNGDSDPPIPWVILDLTRLAAHYGVDYEALRRCCFVGYDVLDRFLVEELEQSGLLRGAALQHVLQVQATQFDRLVGAIADEHGRARSELPSAEQQSAEHVQRLLAGELIDSSKLAYELEAYHVGAVVCGQGATAIIKRLATTLDCRHLAVGRDEESVWAWFGHQERPDPRDLQQLVAAEWPPQLTLALGETGHSIAGWHRTHQQARAAFLVARRTPGHLLRYADVALLTSMAQDDLLTTSLRELYLAPLSDERDGGRTLRGTLRAYFDAGRNGASAAAALNVSRQTVANRLRVVETRVGRPLTDCAVAMEAALRLEDPGVDHEIAERP